MQIDAASINPVADAPASTSSSILLEAALDYAGRSIPVFPCLATGKNAKRPHTEHGFKDASTDPAQIQEWWTAHPDALIGMPTGAVTGFVVLDVDVDPAKGKDGEASLNALLQEQGQELPDTCIVRTPRGGRHIYFVRPGVKVTSRTDALGNGLDVRGDGGYVIVPPSQTTTGAYTWVGDVSEAAQIPDWLLPLITTDKKINANKSVNSKLSPPPVNPEPEQPRKPSSDELAKIEAALAFIPATDRDNWLKVGFAIKSHLGDGGWELFDEWSQTAPESYDEGENRSQWETFQADGGVTIGTLFHLAKQNGWTPERARFKSGSSAESYLGGELAERPIDAATLPDLIDAATFIAKPITPPRELVAGVLHLGSKLVFGGNSKSFKTWCLLALAIAVATATDWLGFLTCRGKVLFLNFEIQPQPWQQRILTVAKAMGVTIEPGQITLWNLRGHAADFRQLIPKIIERCRAENFALIVLDPIYKLYGHTDENSAGNVALLLNALEQLATETGAAIAFGAHFAKGNAAGKEAIDRISGSGVFARDPDSLLIFTKHEADDAFTVEPILRNFAPVKPFVVRWKFPLMQRDADLDPHRLKQAGGRPTKHREDDLLALLPQEGLSTSEWLKAAAAKNISERTYYRLRNALENSGKVLGSVAGGRWVLAPTKNKP